MSNDGQAFLKWLKGEGPAPIIIVGMMLIDCPRCSEQHNHLTYTRFDKPVVDRDGTEWQYWATCPNTGDPILIREAENK